MSQDLNSWDDDEPTLDQPVPFRVATIPPPPDGGPSSLELVRLLISYTYPVGSVYDAAAATLCERCDRGDFDDV